MISDKELTDTQKELLLFLLNEIEKKAKMEMFSHSYELDEKGLLEIEKNILAKIIWMS